MTSSLTQPTPEIETKNEIIWPEGEFYSDEPQWETYLHLKQILLLLSSLEWWWREREDYFAAGNLTVYYSPRQKKSEDFRGPDFFVVLGTTRNLNRKSWVVWQEGGKYPNVIVEILSESTAAVDRGEKKQIYQEIFRTPDYFWFDPESLEFEGFRLMGGRYEPIASTGEGWRWSEQLQLYLGIHREQLRYFTPEGQLVPTPAEAALQERQRAALAQQEAEEERQRAALAQQEAKEAQERVRELEARLRNLGQEPEPF